MQPLIKYIKDTRTKFGIRIGDLTKNQIQNCTLIIERLYALSENDQSEIKGRGKRLGPGTWVTANGKGVESYNNWLVELDKAIQIHENPVNEETPSFLPNDENLTEEKKMQPVDDTKVKKPEIDSVEPVIEKLEKPDIEPVTTRKAKKTDTFVTVKIRRSLYDEIKEINADHPQISVTLLIECMLKMSKETAKTDYKKVLDQLY